MRNLATKYERCTDLCIQDKYPRSYFYNNFMLRSQKGQLLVEILVAITVGGVLLLAATTAIISIVRNNFESRSTQTSALAAYDLMGKVRSFTASDWHNVYNLSHGATSTYFIIPGTTSSLAVSGQESFLSNDIAAGLVSYWKFDESTGTTTYDSSGGSYAGTMNGITRLTSGSCQFGNCFGFNGTSDYVELGTSTAFIGNTTSSRTFSAWVYPTSSAAISRFFSTSAGSADGESYLSTYPSGSNVQFDILWKSASGYTSASSTHSYALNQWYYVTGVIDFAGGKSYVYINGTQDGSISNPASSTAIAVGSNLHARIGANTQPTAGNFFAGRLDDLRVYNRALSANEISQLYSSSAYSRYFYVNSVSRTSGSIDSTYNASNDDPSTQQITTVITRYGGVTYKYYEYLTRFRDKVFSQTNWSGGSGQDGPITSPTIYFSTSTNIAAGSSLVLATTTSSGNLTSSIVDTQVTLGAAMNSVVWQGAANGGSVQFQMAAATSTSGPWNYIGSTGGGSYYSGVANAAIAVANINNYRYIRYKIFLNPSGSNSPRVNTATLNWSP